MGTGPVTSNPQKVRREKRVSQWVSSVKGAVDPNTISPSGIPSPSSRRRRRRRRCCCRPLSPSSSQAEADTSSKYLESHPSCHRSIKPRSRKRRPLPSKHPGYRSFERERHRGRKPEQTSLNHRSTRTLKPRHWQPPARTVHSPAREASPKKPRQSSVQPTSQ
jgi:hypothetical protein